MAVLNPLRAAGPGCGGCDASTAVLTCTGDRATCRGAAADDDVPLVVDLDGTLLRSDLLVESLLGVARRRPSALLKLPAWLAQGRARLKRGLAEHAGIDARTLPFNGELLRHLHAEKRRGRRLLLVTGADERLARAVADEVGLFDAVMASDGRVNLSAGIKRDRLAAEFGTRGYDYVGNGVRDLPVWAGARRGVVVTSSRRLVAAARRVTEVERVLSPQRLPASAWFGAMRLHHWIKNLLLVVPLLAAHRLGDAALLADVLVAALCFGLAASGVYLVNDLLDLPADRRHPRKRQRALACGQLPVAQALALVPALWLAASLLALALPRPFLGALAGYVALMSLYSLVLKDIAIVDALALAAGYALRVEAGALATGLEVSPWLLVCCAALFFGLALLKRYAELTVLRAATGEHARVRAYRVADDTLVASLGLAAGCTAVAVLALYPMTGSWARPAWPVWTLCALLLVWTGHLWLMAHRGRIRDDPVTFALRDRTSGVFGVLMLAVLWIGS